MPMARCLKQATSPATSTVDIFCFMAAMLLVAEKLTVLMPHAHAQCLLIAEPVEDTCGHMWTLSQTGKKIGSFML